MTTQFSDIEETLMADLACKAVTSLIESGVDDDTIVPYWDGETLKEVKDLLEITDEEVAILQDKAPVWNETSYAHA